MAEEIEETFNDPITKLPTTLTLEPCKTKFFTGDMDGFKTELTNGKFKAFSSTYKYNDDYEGRPGFIVKNLVNGFVNQLDDKRKYLFVAFRCQKIFDRYLITATWITNSILTIQEVVPDKYDDFTWEQLSLENPSDITRVMTDFRKEYETTNDLIVAYVH